MLVICWPTDYGRVLESATGMSNMTVVTRGKRPWLNQAGGCRSPMTQTFGERPTQPGEPEVKRQRAEFMCHDGSAPDTACQILSGKEPSHQPYTDDDREWPDTHVVQFRMGSAQYAEYVKAIGHRHWIAPRVYRNCWRNVLSAQSPTLLNSIASSVWICWENRTPPVGGKM